MAVRRTLGTILLVWSLGGLLCLLIPGAKEWAVILPAIPLYELSTAVDSAVRTSGLLWDSAHGPPFLNSAGIFVIYVLPGVVALALLFIPRRTAR